MLSFRSALLARNSPYSGLALTKSKFLTRYIRVRNDRKMYCDAVADWRFSDYGFGLGSVPDVFISAPFL